MELPTALVRSLTILLIGINASEALALKCTPAGQPDQIVDYKHIFLARVVDATFLPVSRDADLEGRTIGYLVPLEVIKGDPQKIPYIEAIVPVGVPCGGCSMPVVATGYTYIIFAEKDGPVRIEDCSPTRRLAANDRECYLYSFRKEAGLIDTKNEHCDEKTRFRREQEQRAYERNSELYRRYEQIKSPDDA